MREHDYNDLIDPADLSGSPVTTPIWEGGFGALANTLIRRPKSAGGKVLDTYHRRAGFKDIGGQRYLIDDHKGRSDVFLVKTVGEKDQRKIPPNYREMDHHEGIILNNGDLAGFMELVFERTD